MMGIREKEDESLSYMQHCEKTKMKQGAAGEPKQNIVIGTFLLGWRICLYYLGTLSARQKGQCDPQWSLQANIRLLENYTIPKSVRTQWNRSSKHSTGYSHKQGEKQYINRRATSLGGTAFKV
jgi:hypothetical protein